MQNNHKALEWNHHVKLAMKMSQVYLIKIIFSNIDISYTHQVFKSEISHWHFNIMKYLSFIVVHVFFIKIHVYLF